MIPNPIIVVLATISLFAIVVMGTALYIVTSTITIVFCLFVVVRIAAIAVWRRVRP